MDFDTGVKLAIYRAFADSARRPSLEQIAAHLGADPDEVEAAYHRLAANRLLVLEPDARAIRMAPPFSGVPTQHRVRADGLEYVANCAWDAFGILAALRRPGEVHSRCEQSHEPVRFEVGLEGPPPSDWLFHCEVPAARWWKDIVFT
jgi:DNA-binding transcriptional MocR family regulator